MPLMPKRPCSQPGCGVLTSSGRCDAHRKQAQKQADAARGSSTQRGYGARWQKASKAYLQAHPLCVCPECKAGELRVTAATVVDHIIPHRGDMKLFWDNTNWQSMGKTCHDRKTAAEDGGFGRAINRDTGGGQISTTWGR
jgi:5-methylcytosine-specific restriction enzyme A